MIVPVDKVNQFLPNDKLELDTNVSGSTGQPFGYALIDDLAATARDIIKSKLALRYNTQGWFDGNTPSLIMNIAGMLVAGWVYDRQYAEEAIEGSSYGTRLIERAYELLETTLSGGMVVADAVFATNVAAQSATYEETEPAFVTTERF